MYRVSFILAVMIAAVGAADTPDGQFIFPLQEQHVHGSSIVETPEGDLLAVWFQGSGERQSDDVRLRGARLRKGGSAWSEVFEMADTPEFPDCNPVLYIDTQKRLWLFWSVVLANRWENCLVKYRRADQYANDGPPEWNWQDVIHLRPGDAFAERIAAAFRELNPSEEMWSEYAHPYSELLIEASRDKLKRQLGWMTRNHPLTLPSGRILLPLYSDGFNVCLMACSDDSGATWYPSSPIVGLGPIQPTLARRKDGSLAAFFRDSGDAPKRAQTATSTDEGITWTVTRDTDIPNPSSSLEVLVLADGRWALICNDLEDGRHRLGVFLSGDEGVSWPAHRYLEEDTSGSNAYAYPSLLQAADGNIHASYSYHTAEGNTIKHASFPPEWLTSASMEVIAPVNAETPAPQGSPSATPTVPETPAPAPEAPDAPIPATTPPAAAAAPEVAAPATPAAPEAPAPAETQASIPAPPPAENADGKSLLESVAAALAVQESFSFDFNAKFTYTRSGTSQEASMEGNVLLGKGNQGLIHIQRTNLDVHTYNNSTARIAFSPGLNRYAPLPVIESRRELIATMTAGTIEPALGWLADMVVGKAATLDNLSITQGKRDVADSWEIQGETADYKLQVALSQGQPGQLLSLAMDFKGPLITKFKFPENASLVIKMDFSNWQLNASHPDSTFSFTAPPDATQTSFEELSSKPKIEIGQPAPDFSLEQLGGGTVHLKDYLGKNVILLEFWSTHCTVCQKATPLIEELAKSFTGREVSIFPINLRETPETIQGFLKEEHPAATVLLDKNAQVGGLYEVTGIPKMVLIGKDGLIKSIFKGMPSGLIETLTGRIQNLLEGKDIGGETDAPKPVSMIVKGAPAPAFELEQLSGGTVQLADHFGNDVIVLCFWSTHCGFCRKAMPQFVEIAKKFSDQKVAFYAVNERETPDKIKTYLEEENLSIPVLLDTTAKVGATYEVKGIPKIVVIGRDALIGAVNQGLPSNLTELLSNQIQSLLP